MKQNKFLILLPILSAVLMTAGCAQEDKAPESAAAQSIAEFEPMPVPEGGWTYEEVAKTVYINGKQISFPFTVESLGEGYSIKKKTTEVEGTGDVWTTLYYKKTPVCSLCYDDLNSPDDLESKNVSRIGIVDVDNFDNECSYEMVKVNGIELFADSSVVKDLFGEPDFGSAIYFYMDSSTGEPCLSFAIDEDKVICMIIKLESK